MESDSTVLHGVTRQNSNPKPDWTKPNRLKPELTYEPIWVKSISKEACEILMRECYKGLENYINLS
ncbi:hypothetical protein A2U01_0100188, partial [Trifolium medium]|nr:hypothetical protein [Trifolium medium]